MDVVIVAAIVAAGVVFATWAWAAIAWAGPMQPALLSVAMFLAVLVVRA
jgi:hypothetical protein